jgi:hypothetical protein
MPKTAGTSIEQCLSLTGRDVMEEELAREDDPDWRVNRDSSKFEKHIDWEISKRNYRKYWDNYFKFGFVRRPYDFLVSYYQTYHRGAQLNLMDEENIFANVQLFCEAMATKGRISLDNFYRDDMSVYFHESLGDEIDFVGRYESLHDDYYKICRRLGIQNPKPLEMKPQRTYAELLERETISYINEHWDEDFRKFNYEKL